MPRGERPRELTIVGDVRLVDARLIAKAPEMLAMIKTYLNDWGDYQALADIDAAARALLREIEADGTH